MQEFEKIIVVSDLHIAPENWLNGEFKAINEFVDWVHSKIRLGYKIVLNGDIFELWETKKWKNWQVIWKTISKSRISSLLENNNVFYIIGNHDAPLKGTVESQFSLDCKIKNKTFHVTHGHVADKFNYGKYKKLGKIITFFVGWFERIFGEHIDEDLGRIENLFLSGKYNTDISDYVDFKSRTYDYVVLGHTHKAEINGKYVNTGKAISDSSFYATFIEDEITQQIIELKGTKKEF